LKTFIDVLRLAKLAHNSKEKDQKQEKAKKEYLMLQFSTRVYIDKRCGL